MNYKVPKEIPVLFHNNSTYDYHSILKKLAKEFEGKFKCLAENTEKYITFSVTIKSDKKITYKIKFIISFRLLPTSLSSLNGNLSNRRNGDKYTDCKSYHDYMSVKDDKLIFKCFECKRHYKKYFNKNLIKRFANAHNFCDGDINKFIKEIFIHINTLTARKNFMKYFYMIKNLLTVAWIWKTLQTFIIDLLKEYLNTSIMKI